MRVGPSEEWATGSLDPRGTGSEHGVGSWASVGAIATRPAGSGETGWGSETGPRHAALPFVGETRSGVAARDLQRLARLSLRLWLEAGATLDEFQREPSRATRLLLGALNSGAIGPVNHTRRDILKARQMIAVAMKEAGGVTAKAQDWLSVHVVEQFSVTAREAQGARAASTGAI